MATEAEDKPMGKLSDPFSMRDETPTRQVGLRMTIVSRLQRKIVQSIETSSLHLELIADMKRLNSLFCSSAYVVLETSDTGALEIENMADITHSP